MDYTCCACGKRCSVMGHWAEDERGSYYKCQEPERSEAQLVKMQAECESKERAELVRLKAKYPEA